MLRIVAFLSLSLLLPGKALAGDYDGVWVFSDVTDSDYFLVLQRDSTLLLVGVNLELDGWDAFIGNVGQANAARLRTLVTQDGSEVDFTISFTSPTAAQLVVLSCDACELPLGTPLALRRIF